MKEFISYISIILLIVIGIVLNPVFQFVWYQFHNSLLYIFISFIFSLMIWYSNKLLLSKMYYLSNVVVLYSLLAYFINYLIDEVFQFFNYELGNERITYLNLVLISIVYYVYNDLIIKMISKLGSKSYFGVNYDKFYLNKNVLSQDNIKYIIYFLNVLLIIGLNITNLKSFDIPFLNMSISLSVSLQSLATFIAFDRIYTHYKNKNEKPSSTLKYMFKKNNEES